jgi:glucosamine 6-phosphate synthetase-like amidotransferase/phosphosugar isomerase protein
LSAIAPMLADIARQPDVLAGLIGRTSAFEAAGEALRPGPGGRLFVAGCGDGLFAAEAAGLFAAEARLDWRPIGALDLVLSAARLTPQDRVICISMSGNVDRTVEAATAVAGAGVPLLAMVNGEGGRLGSIATAKISLDLPDIAPFLCGTASYGATIAALMMIASGASGTAADLDHAVPAMRSALAQSEAVAEAIAAEGMSGARFLAAGAETGTARYGAAKFVELTRNPAWSADLEEFAHSQYWAMPASDLVVVVATGSKVAGYARESCRALAELGVRTLAVDTESTPVETATHRVTLPYVPETLAPLASCIPLQRLAYAAAQATGLDPDTRLHLKEDSIRFSVSRKLTRRSLLGTGL